MLKQQRKRMTVDDGCMGCLACEVACKQEHNLPVGPRWLRVSPDVREANGRLRFNYLVTECVHAGPPPCQAACPIDLNAWHYVTLISEGKFQQALQVIREVTPLAGVLGCVCTRPCESECERGQVDASIGIRALKRFVADYERQSGRNKATPVEKTKESRVAIIGAGPSGLSCAYDLIRQGYPVTVFEAEPKAGGHLRYGIPEFRLPRSILDNEISYIEELGVAIKTNARVSRLDDIFKQGYQAIFVAVGAHVSQKLGTPGEESGGVTYALDFLKQLNSGKKTTLGNRVAVIGGGNTAVDAARVAKRLGAKEVSIIYRRSRAEMPAMATEVEEAEREGIQLSFLAAPVAILSKDGKLSSIRCSRMELGGLDATGRRAPVPVKGSEFNVEVDNLLVAIGESVDEAALPQGLGDASQGTLYINPNTMQTNLTGVFAGGDVAIGPSDVVRAIATGKEAATSIDRYLRGVDLNEGRLVAFKELRMSTGADSRKRVITITDSDVAAAEARRCLNCGTCDQAIEIGFQTACTSACPAHCIYFRDVWGITPKTGTYTLV